MTRNKKAVHAKYGIVSVGKLTAAQIESLDLFCQAIDADMYCTAENLDPLPPPIDGEPKPYKAKRRPKTSRPAAKRKAK